MPLLQQQCLRNCHSRPATLGRAKRENRQPETVISFVDEKTKLGELEKRKWGKFLTGKENYCQAAQRWHNDRGESKRREKVNGRNGKEVEIEARGYLYMRSAALTNVRTVV